MVEMSLEPSVERKTTPAGRWKLDLLGAGLVFALALFAYLSTMEKSFGWGDSSELMIAAYHLGIGHSPGYPTWMLLMYPFAHLPFGTVALRLNFATTLFGAIAAAGLYWLFLTATRHRLASFVAALSFAFALTFWDTTRETEVYTLHVTLTAAILLVALWWRRKQQDRQLYLLAWMVGISLGNHALTALLIPALLYLVWAERGPAFFTARRLLLLTAFFLLGFAVYCYLPIRAMADPPPRANTANWLYHMSARGARNVMFSKSPLHAVEKAGRFLSYLGRFEFGWLGLGLGLVGLATLWRRDRRLLWFTLLILLTDLGYASNFSVFDSYVFFLPIQIIWAFYLACGAAHVVTWTGAFIAAREQGRTLSPVRQYGAVSAILLLLPLLLFTYHQDYIKARGEGDVNPEQFARASLAMAAPHALILGDWWHIAPMAYLKYVEGVRPDVGLDSAASLETTEKFMQYADPVWLKRFPAVYFTELLTNRAETIRQGGNYLVPEGPLWRIYAERPPAEQLLTTVDTPPLASFGQEVALARADVPSRTFDPAGVLQLTLYWTVLPEFTKRYRQVTVVIENDRHEPVFWQTTPLGYDLYPQHLLKPGQTVREPRSLYVGRPLPPGKYHLLVRVKGRHGSPFPCDHPVPGRDAWSYEVTPLTLPPTQAGTVASRVATRG